MVDGQLARTKNLETPGGAFLDSTIDRLCDGLIFAGCVVYYSGSAMMYVSLAALITCYLVSYTRARSESLGLYGAEGSRNGPIKRIVMLGIAPGLLPVGGPSAGGRRPSTSPLLVNGIHDLCPRACQHGDRYLPDCMDATSACRRDGDSRRTRPRACRTHIR